MDQLSPQRLYAFEPDALRAEGIDRRVRQNLASSLSAIFADVGAALEVSPEQSATLIAAIDAGPISPRVVATYADMVEAIYQDEDERARSLAHALMDAPASAPGLRALTLSDQALGASQANRYARHAFDGEQTPTLAPTSDEELTKLTALLDEAAALINRAAPALWAEIGGLTREVVFVQGGDGFGGATSFYLWGAMLLNATKFHDRVTLATAIIHEAAHSFLFGVNLGARLTENPAEEVCASPLRVEPRPVEGVFHATFVLARMIYGLEHMLASGALTPSEIQAAHKVARQSAEDFDAGLKSLAIARLTPGGAALLASARRYVEGRPKDRLVATKISFA